MSAIRLPSAKRTRGQYSTTPLPRALRQLPQYLLLAVVGLIFFAPVYYMFVGSFRSNSRALNGIAGFIPDQFTLDNYVGVFQQLSTSSTGYMAGFIGVSTIVALLVVVGSLIVNSMAGYAFARLRWTGRTTLFLIVTVLMVLPFEAFAIPLYVLLAGYRDTITIQVLPFIANAFSIYLFYTFFLDLPRELEEAARIDGSSPFRTFWQVIVPISRPAFATVAILTFLWQWGSYLWPVLSISDPVLRPLPLELSVFSGQLTPQWGLTLAFGVIFVLPVLVVFIVFQRWFVASVASSAVKG